jgi:spore coat protein U-like protein
MHRFPLRRFIHRQISVCIRIVIFLLAASTSAYAQTCTVSMPAMAFGNVDVLPGAAVDITTTLTVTCSGGSGGAGGQHICISIGAGSSSDTTSRKMNGPSSNTARYDFYSNSTRTQLWGSWQTGFDSAGVQLEVARNTTTHLTVYGRFFGTQTTVVAGLIPRPSRPIPSFNTTIKTKRAQRAQPAA